MEEQVLRNAIKLDVNSDMEGLECTQCGASILEGDQYIKGIFGCCGNKCITWCLNCANKITTIVSNL